MALNNAYNYIRKHIDPTFNKMLIEFAQFPSDDLIEDCVNMIEYYGKDAPVYLYPIEVNNIIIFPDFDIATCDAIPIHEKYISTTLQQTLDILTMQDTMINEDIEALNKFIC